MKKLSIEAQKEFDKKDGERNVNLKIIYQIKLKELIMFAILFVMKDFDI